MNIGRHTCANGGVFSRYFCDQAQCFKLLKYDYKDVVPTVIKDEGFQSAIDEVTKQEVTKEMQAKDTGGGDAQYAALYRNIRKKVEARALRVLNNISSAMSNAVLKFVAWVCHKAIRRIAGGGCGTRMACVERLRRAKAAGLPLIFVPLHRSHLDYILVTFTLYLTGLRPPLVAAGDNMRIPFFGWFLRGCGAFFIRRRVDGSDKHGDPIYKSALRSYILNSLAANNNLEFFIEGGRTRTGKPQPPKAGILSVIMDAYLDGTIDDALLVPVSLNYDKLVDGNFVREQLGMPKQMETFWSALRGIWSTLNTNHGSIRVDFNQPISLKELVTSFQKYNYLKMPVERPLTPPNNNNLGVDLDHRILYNNSHSSLFGADVSADHKLMIEAIGRHLVYDASQATALMCTNVVSYVLLTEHRSGCTMKQLQASVENRGQKLSQAGRDLGYTGDTPALVHHALDMLGRGLVRREGSGDKQVIKPQLSIAASIELGYYANTVGAHYAPAAIMATALESILHQPGADHQCVRHTELLDTALQLCEVLQLEFILAAPCTRLRETMLQALDALIHAQVLRANEKVDGIEEQRWSRRLAARLEEDDEERPDPTAHLRYTVGYDAEAIAERRRLVLTIRPLLEAYSSTCRALSGTGGSQKELVKRTLDQLANDFTQNRMPYGEAVSTDAIRNCHRLLRQWGVLEMYEENKTRCIRLAPPYTDPDALQRVVHNIHKFNVDAAILRDK
ncbi:glycerol-3-phosphate acyltransferase 1, mitochondrial [Ostrinia furnacalis]|uniref:glycerol-3-phosphate acyltransferase 1, mitochondrial n=1 Tax=Ostrinia furnacalis TaxID=93504 RepID=UPI00103D248D|nr:glycerol-3-phosphate acyltransferase 1, mitochondrial [Ostrinia furnacalis]